MNDTSNDGTESTDPTEGILADLANLQQSVSDKGSAHEDVNDNVRARLDDIAEAAESLRTGDDDDDDDEPDEPTPRSRGPKPARDAVANRGLVFESFVRGESENDEADADEDDESGDEADDSAAGPTSVSFDPRNPFAAPPAAPAAAAPTEPRATPSVPPAGGLIFQVPKAEHAEVVQIDDESDDDWDDSEDTDDTATDRRDDQDDDESSNGPRRRRGGRGRRSRSRDDSNDGADGQSEDSSEESQDDDDSQKEGSRSSRRGSRSNSRGSKHKSDSDSDSQDTHSKAENEKSDQSKNDEPQSDDGDDDDDSDGGSRRRRRRRSRTRGTDRDEVTSLKGSTRLEAKRQRRKEGREAGRRRPIITEAEFLARRESVERTMLVRESGDQTQLVVVEDGIAVEHYLKENRQQSSLIGNVYLGKVQNVLPSMEAAFIDIGKGRNAVLYAGEVNWDALGMDGKARRIETALSPGDSVLVQVTKDPIGHKGARLTSQISLPGRFLVYVPGNSMTGISRKLPDNERARLKKLLKELVGDSNGVIVRTAAEGAADTDLSRDVERLAKRWETIEKKSKSTKVLAPQLLYSEPDMIVRIIRDVFNEDFNSLVIDGDGAWNTIHEYVESVAPDLLDRVHSYNEDEDVFDHYRIEEQIQKALQRTVNLPSGGSLVIDRTEAMTVVDVNTGKFTGSGGNLEETVTRNNLEAAEEVIRQVRLRDIGGIIVVDFIDMVLESNRDLVVRRLVECLGRDRTKHQVAEVTSLGLVQMTRKRIGTGLAESMVSAGADLSGRGLLLPGSEEDGSKSHRGNRSSNNDSRRDRKRRGDSGSKSKQNEAESHEDSVSSDASRSAVAAIAKATLKKDEADSGNGEEKPGAEANGKSRSRSRSGRRRSNSRNSETASETETSSASETNAGTEAKAVDGDKAATVDQARAEAKVRTDHRSGSSDSEPETAAKQAPEEPKDLPLMIGADTATRVAAAPVKRAPARKPSDAPKQTAEPQQEQLPTSFVIIGED
ncbi:Rne/Rng family ribonuclease [Brevibacterium oceani]|uniref:Rne/Rng family ribonuclease n=1 Tax=Brevibacterium oceani TaxID=358099 RepID=UPI002159F438|nr:Rne/Rng family ribonuclease [Brevibacterium oceani]